MTQPGWTVTAKDGRETAGRGGDRRMERRRGGGAAPLMVLLLLWAAAAALTTLDGVEGQLTDGEQMAREEAPAEDSGVVETEDSSIIMTGEQGGNLAVDQEDQDTQQDPTTVAVVASPEEMPTVSGGQDDQESPTTVVDVGADMEDQGMLPGGQDTQPVPTTVPDFEAGTEDQGMLPDGQESQEGPNTASDVGADTENQEMLSDGQDTQESSTTVSGAEPDTEDQGMLPDGQDTQEGNVDLPSEDGSQEEPPIIPNVDDPAENPLPRPEPVGVQPVPVPAVDAFQPIDVPAVAVEPLAEPPAPEGFGFAPKAEDDSTEFAAATSIFPAPRVGLPFCTYVCKVNIACRNDAPSCVDKVVLAGSIWCRFTSSCPLKAPPDTIFYLPYKPADAPSTTVQPITLPSPPAEPGPRAGQPKPATVAAETAPTASVAFVEPSTADDEAPPSTFADFAGEGRSPITSQSTQCRYVCKDSLCTSGNCRLVRTGTCTFDADCPIGYSASTTIFIPNLAQSDPPGTPISTNPPRGGPVDPSPPTSEPSDGSTTPGTSVPSIPGGSGGFSGPSTPSSPGGSAAQQTSTDDMNPLDDEMDIEEGGEEDQFFLDSADAFPPEAEISPTPFMELEP